MRIVRRGLGDIQAPNEPNESQYAPGAQIIPMIANDGNAGGWAEPAINVGGDTVVLQTGEGAGAGNEFQFITPTSAPAEMIAGVPNWILYALGAFVALKVFKVI